VKTVTANDITSKPHCHLIPYMHFMDHM